MAPQNPTASTTTSTTTNSVFRRSYIPPTRDEETETQRKARAKHARQTRRSTQGVSLEDIEKAEESLRDPSKVPKETDAQRAARESKESAAATTVSASASTGIPTATTT